MELGIFIQTPIYAHEREQEGYEHTKLMQDLELAEAADKAGFKYVLGSEHHFLDEYSHMSANDVLLSYLAAKTNNIHLVSAIFNPLPQVIHPAKLAETVAMLDHVSEGRFEFGTGRGAGSHEILGFLPGMEDLTGTREIWEDVIREFPKMWLQDEYEGYEGKFWSLPPRKILPKPYGKSHPAMWYACGNQSSYDMCAENGLGVLGFSIGSFHELEAVVDNYKSKVKNVNPIGDFVNDNILVVGIACVAEDAKEAERQWCNPNWNYHISNVYRYHDTFPRPAEIPAWPAVIPPNTPESVAPSIETGTIIGDPDHALEQCKRWEAAGCDQLIFGLGMAPHEESLEMIRLVGEHVIPKIDPDPVHRTTKMRQNA